MSDAALSLNEFSGLINLINTIVLSLTLFIVNQQTRASNKIARITILQALYDRHRLNAMSAIENPNFGFIAMREETRVEFMKDGAPDLEKISEKFRLDMIIDEAEYFFLLSEIEDSDHNRRLVKRMMSNQKVINHWKSPLRGTVRENFQSFVEQYYRERDAK